MPPTPSMLRLLLCAALLLAVVAGCASTEGTTDGTPADSAAAAPPGPDLAPTSADVRTVQLYRNGDERQLPILPLRASGQLHLEFDLMADEGRPLSIYFFHADRNWRRDLAPAEFLDSFTNDNLIDYRLSYGTEVPYVHYSYRFPNDDIRFLMSGNYILRVTEQGRREDVLFERAFFLTEEAGALELGIEGIVVSGQRQPSDRPVARFSPPAELRGDTFGYGVCFVRNGRFAAARCNERPRLAQQPILEFELERSEAFAPTTADYFLDLSTLRVGGQIERTDRSTSPFHALLEPDYARFAGDALSPQLAGQIVVQEAVTDVPDPQVAAEYVRTTFSFVPPDEQPFDAEVVIAGSFTDHRYDPDLRMAWVPERGRYEGDVLLKQGLYEYYYDSSDPRLRQVLRQNLPRTRDTYTALVYYNDASRNTDRLLSTAAVQGP